MPIDTLQEARDEILGHFAVAWATLPTPPPVSYPDKSFKPPDSGPYAKVILQHEESPQRTLGGKISLGGGGTRFGRIGLLTIQIITDALDCLTTSYPLVDLVVDAFEGENTGSDRVDFHNVRANEVGTLDGMHQTNVVMEFRYDRVK